jgi:ribose-phosphate pyrophosphokinase
MANPLSTSPRAIIAFKGGWTLPKTVAARLNIPLHLADVSYFSDGELKVSPPETSAVRGRELFVFPPQHVTPSDFACAFIFLGRILRSMGARKLVAVLPYIPFSRQDKMIAGDQFGSPLHMFFAWLKSAGYYECITVWMHKPDLIDTLALPVHMLSVGHLFAQHIKQRKWVAPNCWLIAPDKGAIDRVKEVSSYTGLPYVIFEKQRDEAGVIVALKTIVPDRLYGDMVAILVDDIIATGGTALSVCRELKRHGFTKMYGCFAHPVLTPEAHYRLTRCQFKQLAVTDSLQLLPEFTYPNYDITPVDISPLLADIISRVMLKNHVPRSNQKNMTR